MKNYKIGHLIVLIFFLYIPFGLFYYLAANAPLIESTNQNYPLYLGYELWQYVFGFLSIFATNFFIKDKRLF